MDFELRLCMDSIKPMIANRFEEPSGLLLITYTIGLKR